MPFAQLPPDMVTADESSESVVSLGHLEITRHHINHLDPLDAICIPKKHRHLGLEDVVEIPAAMFPSNGGGDVVSVFPVVGEDDEAGAPGVREAVTGGSAGEAADGVGKEREGGHGGCGLFGVAL